MSTYIPPALRDLVRQRARRRCEYCQSAEWLTGLLHQVDHIRPRYLGGENVADNLCLACPGCNGYKQAHTEAVDPASGELVPLYNPRNQRWHDHFVWEEGGIRLAGRTPVGRATVACLNMNHPTVVVARSLWKRTGYHPPD